MKKIIILTPLLLLIGVGGFYLFNIRSIPTTPPPQETETLVYTNTTYGFSIELPKDWEGYTLVPASVQFGQAVTLRHPLWTEENKYMDIPVLIYPIAQWEIWEKNNFEGYPTAAPIGPTERGRNARYVFATAPRYNFSFGTGFETVEEIIKNLKTF